MAARCNPPGNCIVSALDITQRGIPRDAKRLGRVINI